MRKFLFILLLLATATGSWAQVQSTQQRQLTIQLAVRYYNESNFEKAAPLLKEVISNASSSYYFRLYLTSLIELQHYEQAEKEIKNELKRKRYPEAELYVNWGYLYHCQDRTEEATKKYNQALEKVPNAKNNYISLANLFLHWDEYEYAKETYLQGRKKLQGESFHYELARVYYLLLDFERMMTEYLDALRSDERRLPQIQSTIGSALNLDVDNELRDLFRTMVLKRIQTDPNQLIYNRLFIWFLLQEKNFSGALRQTIALDRRTKNEDANIARLARIAVNNHEFKDAQRAYQYLMDKGEENPYFLQSFIQNIQLSYEIFKQSDFSDPEQGSELAQKFKAGLEYLQYMPETYSMIKDYAHLLAFYLKQPARGVEILENGLQIRGLNSNQKGVLKTEMADIYVYSGDPWEAMLLYAQVIEENKNNELADEVKLKKAKLSYYLGNFEYAQAQLDVIKAGTSKLTANDAFELALLIGNNLNLDTTHVPLRMFSRADFLFFRNEDSLALLTLDSLQNNYPYHTLVDDILFRKARINITRGHYPEAVANLEKIIADFSYESLADDALFLLAETHHYHLKDLDKAREYYNQMLLVHPGSIYVVESRKRFRELRGDFMDEESPEKETEERFFYERGI